MERAAIYGDDKYKSCGKCSWTGPFDTFESVPALIASCVVLRCPNCGGMLDVESRVFVASRKMLPEGFTIVSGGQTGVDRGALDAALVLGIPHQGWCPRGRKAEDGVIPVRYNLQEMKGREYWKRTEQNVLDSDGTLVLPGNCDSRGTALTIRLARKHGKPVVVVPLESKDAQRTVAAWICAEKVGVMNVAGPRESGNPGIYARTRAFLINVLSSLRSVEG